MMSDDSATGDAQERATIRLVSEQVKGLRDMTELGFTSLQRQLDAVAGVPAALARLEAQNIDQERRLQEQADELADLEKDRQGRAVESRTWRRVHLPAMVLSAMSLIATIVFISLSIH